MILFERTFRPFLLQLYLMILVKSYQPLEVGSCSRKCETPAPQVNDTLSQISNLTVQNLRSFKCSCSSSCGVYGDCCYDSEFRTTVHNTSTKMMCLSFLNKGQYLAVAKCSNHWTESSIFCTEGIGHLPPVTSKATGNTYANIHCAICNGDVQDLVTWKVELRCCAEHDNIEDQSGRRFIYRDGYLQSVIPRRTDGIRRRCTCQFFAHGQDYSFTDILELRMCQMKLEISKCSTTWDNETIDHLCSSFLEPVYTRNKVYRNLYCAQCNYENLDSVLCKPAIVQRMALNGSSDNEIFDFCVENSLQNCIYYLGMDRGSPYPFSRLFNIYERGCIPQTGKRCCSGERYDFRSKRCRKLHRS